MTPEMAGDISVATGNGHFAGGAPNSDALNGDIAGEQNPLLKIPRTDSGNGERLALQHGHELRYCHAHKAFYYYHPTKEYWERDRCGFAHACTKGIARALYKLASAILDRVADIKDESKRKEASALAVGLVAWARNSEAAERRKAALTCFQSEPGIPIQPTDFDRDPDLLNVLNGTLDLKSFELRTHRPEDYITRQCPVTFDPDARSPLWERFLHDATGGDAELEAFIQRAAGYSLLGANPEEVFFIVHGPTASCKSTFLEALKAMLGSYAITASTESFLVKRGSSIPNDIAALAGRRLVIAIEADHGRKLAESLIKSMTGGDTMTARFLYAEFFEFKPQFALWLGTNHLPRVNHADDSLWRRILRVPFVHQIPKERRDPAIKETLCAPEQSGAAIFAWAMRGLKQYREIGLRPPDCVVHATTDYRQKQNLLADFIEEHCTLDPEGKAAHSYLLDRFEQYNLKRRRDPVDVRDFKQALKLLGCVPTTLRVDAEIRWQTPAKAVTKGWRGLRVREETDDDVDFPAEQPEATERIDAHM